MQELLSLWSWGVPPPAAHASILGNSLNPVAQGFLRRLPHTGMMDYQLDRSRLPLDNLQYSVRTKNVLFHILIDDLGECQEAARFASQKDAVLTPSKYSGTSEAGPVAFSRLS